MAEYIEREAKENTCKDCIHYAVCVKYDKHILYVNELFELAYVECVDKECEHFKPTADVVPRAEVEKLHEVIFKKEDLMQMIVKEHQDEIDRLECTLLGVMHSVDKWLEGDELKQDEVNRAATMREKTLQIIENLNSEVAREIFEELEEIFNKRIAFYTDMKNQSTFNEKKYAETMITNCTIYLQEIAELKKKYTGEHP